MKSKTRKPTVAQAEAAIKKAAYNIYKDPESLKVRNVAVHEFCYARGKYSYYPDAWGYRITASTDAKNGRGAYSGYASTSYVGSSDRVIPTDSENPYYPGRIDTNYFFYSRAELPAGPTTPQ
jgi:hypothetical protein